MHPRYGGRQLMILVHFSSVGREPRVDVKVRLPAVPSAGDDCNLGARSYRVHRIVWFPTGDAVHPEPLVYIVLR